MSSVLFQSFNNNGLGELRTQLNRLNREIAEARKDITYLVQALEAKAPEAAEEFARLKAQEASLLASQRAQRPVEQSRASAPQVNNSYYNRR